MLRFIRVFVVLSSFYICSLFFFSFYQFVYLCGKRVYSRRNFRYERSCQRRRKSMRKRYWIHFFSFFHWLFLKSEAKMHSKYVKKSKNSLSPLALLAGWKRKTDPVSYELLSSHSQRWVKKVGYTACECLFCRCSVGRLVMGKAGLFQRKRGFSKRTKSDAEKFSYIPTNQPTLPTTSESVRVCVCLCTHNIDPGRKPSVR